MKREDTPHPQEKLTVFSLEQKAIFQKLGVDIVYVFGSFVDKTHTKKSDIDFGIVFSDPNLVQGKFFHVYGEIYEIILDILPESYLQRRKEMHAHECDIVFLQLQASARMRYVAAMNGEVLYRSSLEAVADFREHAMLEFFDTKYFESIKTQAFIN